MNRGLAIAGWGLGVAGACVPALVAAPQPVLTRTAPGQFEIASVDVSSAEHAMTEGSAAWRLLAGPLGLPAAFPSPIFVRLVPAADWTEAVPFHVTAEPGGVVSVRVRWSESTPTLFLRRALVQALLVRLGVAAQGVSPQLAAPLWLEQACVGWWRTREEPAQLDALQQESASLAPPALEALLNWRRSDVEPRVFGVGAIWLLSWLQAESGRAGEWPALRARLLAGEEPLAALATCYPGRFADAIDRELWWQTGWHHVRRLATQPQLGGAESRVILGDMARFVFDVGGRDTVLPLRFALRQSEDPMVAALLAARAKELQRAIPGLHPFYRNAGLALAGCLAVKRRSGDELAAACAEFDREWGDAVELEATAREALDTRVRRR
ncbi:MAG: hypothetical protein H7343_17205 [Undibacterium sp.]|nr:hypothetical protein [Opitutaceae bacterium]